MNGKINKNDMKKKLLTLAKGLDFQTESEYFDYCIDSFINGNFTQCRKLFNDMRKQDRKELVNYIHSMNQYTEIRNFYFNLL